MEKLILTLFGKDVFWDKRLSKRLSKSSKMPVTNQAKHCPNHLKYTFMQINKLSLISLAVLILGAATASAQTKDCSSENSKSCCSAKKQASKTQAYLGEKSDYTISEGYYTGGKFSCVHTTKVPSTHFAHDALYQFEGPGWESEKVGYRLYLDQRNRTDIFGKKKPEMVLHQTGINDLVSDGKESYQKMQDWGQDIFKVGNSLGIGSIAAFNDSVITVSAYDSLLCEIVNSADNSSVRTMHYGWNTGESKNNIETVYSINPGSRMTHVQAEISEFSGDMCTGLAKHADTEYIKSDKAGWNYIALWGKQTLINDNLGIAVFYKKDNFVKLAEDNSSYIVVLKPADNKLGYYFAAAWEQEQGGIKTKDEFIKYLDGEINNLDNSVSLINKPE